MGKEDKKTKAIVVPYESKGITQKLGFTSRMSIKVKDSFYTVEASEERVFPDIEGIDWVKEKEMLWESINIEIDTQIRDILNVIHSK